VQPARPPRLLPAVVVALATALLVLLAGGGDAFWLGLPGALLIAALARSAGEATLAAALGTFAAALPALAYPSLGPLPPFPLVLLVVAGSVTVLHTTRARLMTERAALRVSALSDPLTGLANRRALAERVGYEVARHARLGHSFALVALDLDGFKLVNDRFGHQAGDDLLRELAHALLDAVRDQDTVARIGGDEFCVLAPETGASGGERLAARVDAAVRRVGTGLEALSASVGVAVFPDDGGSAAAVLEAADRAAIEHKRRRRAAVRRAA
jgi:diguanylate cyclase